MTEMSAWPIGKGEMARLIRDHRWEETALGSPSNWPQPLRDAVQLMLDMPLLATLAIGTERVFLYNDAAAPLYGTRHPAVLGAEMPRAFADDFDKVADHYDRVFSGESVHVQAQALDPSQSGTPDRFDAYLAPVRGADGTVLAAWMTGFAADARSLAEQKLRDSERRFRLLFETIDEGFCIAERVPGEPVDFRYVSANPAFERQSGLTDPVGKTMRALVPTIEDEVMERYRRVLDTGKSHRFTSHVAELNRWFEIEAFATDWPGRIGVLFRDVTERERAQQVLRQSEDRQVFLLRLSDALRPLADAKALRVAACRLLAEQLGTARVYYVEFDPRTDCGIVEGDYFAPGQPSLAGRYPAENFRSTYDRVGSGETWVVADAASEPDIAENERAEFLALKVSAWIDVPLVKDGQLVSILCATADRPRGWTPDEIRLVEEVAERLWLAAERNAAEARVQESEERYRTLFETMDEGFVVGELVRDEAGEPVDFRYLELNPAIERLVGWKAEETVGRLMSEVITAEETRRWVDDFASVIATGRSLQTEHGHPSLGMWFRANTSPVGGDRVALVYQNVTVQKRAELVLRESEERQAFLLRFSDTLRAAPVDALIGRAAEMLADELQLDLCYFVTVDLEGDCADVLHQARRGDMPAVPEMIRLSDFPQAFTDWQDRTLVSEDMARDPVLTETDRRNVAAMKFGALIAAPVRRGPGRPVWSVVAVMNGPRCWTPGEIALVEEVAERTWAIVERARAEEAVRRSETRLRGVLDAMTEGFALFAPDFTILDVNQESVRLDGRPREELVGRSHWDAYPGSADAPIGKLYKRVVETRLPGVLEHEYLWPDGRSMWIDTRAYATPEGGVAVFWRDITDRKRIDAALRESEARLALAFQTLPIGLSLIDRDGQVVTTNDEMQRFLPDDAGASDDWAQAEHWRGFRADGEEVGPEQWPTARALRGEDHVKSLEMLYRQDDGAEIWTQVLSAPIRDADGAVTGAFTAVIDIDRLKRSEAALRRSEAQLAAAFESVPGGVGVTDLSGRTVLANSEFRRFLPTGVMPSRDPERGKRWRAWDEQGMPVARENFPGARALRGERVIPGQEMVYQGDDGREIWTSVAAVPTHDDKGAITGFVCVIQDIDALRRADEAVRDSERRLQTLVQGVPQLVFRAVDGGKWTWASPQWTGFTGQVEGDSHALGWLDAVHPDDREMAKAIWHRAIDRGEFHADYRICHAPEKRYRWFQTRATPVRDDAGNVVEWLGTSTDVDDLRRLQERQHLLLAELQHRVRNILATIRSVARRSAEGADDVEDYWQHLEGRITAMARTQALLTRRVGARVDLQNLVLDELDAQAGLDRVSIRGPDVALSPKAAEIVVLAVHELATNAIKYGALSRPHGRIDVVWTIDAEAPAPTLRLLWREPGTAFSEIPHRRGFGTELITERVPYELNGAGRMEFGPDGFTAIIEFPLAGQSSILQTDAILPGDGA